MVMAVMITIGVQKKALLADHPYNSKWNSKN